MFPFEPSFQLRVVRRKRARCLMYRPRPVEPNRAHGAVPLPNPWSKIIKDLGLSLRKLLPN